ncbi:MAG: sensor histidine kinase [Bacteroidetes bacterium]|nr:sensor histidine kinase [Bacteroidota bacterium]
MIRNPTPSLISLISSFIVSVVCTFFVFAFSKSIGIAFSMFGVINLVCFLVFYYSLEIFIYRKIKLIYKTIHDVKSQKKNTTFFRKIDIDADPIGEVEQEVVDWVETSSSEIALLRKQEEFRKEFLGNVSHELKTPIFNLQGYIHTLLDGALHDPEVNVRFLEKAGRSADRMSALVQDLISISQLEAGQMTMDVIRFDINELVKDIFEQLEVRALTRGIRFHIKDGCDTTFFVKADKYRIRQVLVNLIINAIQYGKEKGQITVAFYDMGENILTEVADDGEGIENEHLHRLFERFYRVDKSRSRDEGGTGLGLAIVKHIIEAHNQTINVRSKIGKGTTFGFTLSKG